MGGEHMIFPDARTRMPTPVFSQDTIDGLKACAYQNAVVELSAATQGGRFSFLRPPGWRVGAPVLSSRAPMPMTPLASFLRDKPRVAMDLLLYRAPYDCLPGDFLDAHLDGLRLSHRSEGPLGDGWYADRMGRMEAGYQILAGHRKGRDLYLFLCATPSAALPMVRDEVSAILATFRLRDPVSRSFAERWRRHDDSTTGLTFALPAEVQPRTGPLGLELTWPLAEGALVLSLRSLLPRDGDLACVEAGFRQQLLRTGIRLSPARVGDLPASAAGIFAGEVAIRLYESTSSSRESVEALLLVGRRKDGGRLGICGTYPARSRAPDSWMRARFAIVQIAATMKPGRAAEPSARPEASA